jgi:hypothetical protein
MRPLMRSPTELAFWLFMLNQRPGKSQWFSSFEYKMWFFGALFLSSSVRLILTIIDHSGSFVAILGLPLAALVTRNDIVTVITFIRALGRGHAE